MRQNARISVIIPALNEETPIARVLDAIPRWVDEVIVADNGSTDSTAAVAQAHGARVVTESRRGYGSACLAGLAAVNEPDIVVFLDADFSDHPDEMDKLVDPIVRGDTDLAIGSRVRGARERGALTPQARFGNWLSCLLIRLFWGVTYSDLGPFRAVRYSTLRQLCMQDRNFGWTVEMQVKAAAASMRTTEVPVRYRKRIGASKISGTVRGVILAGTKILYTIFRAAYRSDWRHAQTPPEALILFARFPIPGQAKTRLIPALGREGAARLHRRMTEHAVAVARAARAAGDTAITICCTGAECSEFRSWLGSDLNCVDQPSGDLGIRLQRAFELAFAGGATRAMAFGADVPGLSADILRQATDALAEHDVVLGPATDGGYYLIGMKRVHPELFAGIDWGTGRVAEQTRAAMGHLNMSVAELPALNDIDRPEDLAPLRSNAQFADAFTSPPLLSVIIPTLEEAEILPATLEHLRHINPIEIIVADGGSRDVTRDIARKAGATVLNVSGGRSSQLNAGAALAKGQHLLFLHADTLPPDGFTEMIRQTLDEPAVVAGVFRFRTDGAGWGMGLVEWGTNVRSAVFRWPYGDQGLFLEKRVFKELGGFADLPIMEDIELVRRLRRRGRMVIRAEAATTSARRWRRQGTTRTILRNQLMLLGFLVGVTPEALARFYRTDRYDGRTMVAAEPPTEQSSGTRSEPPHVK